MTIKEEACLNQPLIVQQGSSESLKYKQARRQRSGVDCGSQARQRRWEQKGTMGSQRLQERVLWRGHLTTGRCFRVAFLVKCHKDLLSTDGTDTARQTPGGHPADTEERPRKGNGTVLKRTVPAVGCTQDSHCTYCTRQSLGPGVFLASELS